MFRRWLTHCWTQLKKLEAVTKNIEKVGGKCTFTSVDVTNESQIDKLLLEIKYKKGKLDVIINNAYSGNSGTLIKGKTQDYQDAFALTVSSSAYLIKSATNLLKTGVKKSGKTASIINISSMYGLVSPDPRIYGLSGENSPPWYGAAKAALIQYTRYAAIHMAHDQIRVNCISPGPFPSQDLKKKLPDFWSKLEDKTPLGRLGKSNELQGAILFLASNASSFCTGINLPIDGGWTAW